MYVTLNRMVDDGLIQEAERPDGTDARQKYYAASELGRAVVAAELDRLEVLMAVARRDVLAPGRS
ncbi:MAG: helix-turn-helix transcriptional regulator [Gemmatimonadetes bacterium]|nr:helix-turn-helix transcriptional regulator [Gemmatimonadota bacterium]